MKLVVEWSGVELRMVRWDGDVWGGTGWVIKSL